MTRAPAIFRPETLAAKDRGGGARTTLLVTKACGSTGIFNGITHFDPGAAIATHIHNCEESVMVIEGQAVVEIDGVRHHLNTFDTTWLPPDVPHRFLNETDRPMKILWIYADVNATRTLVATGESRSIDAEHGLL